MNFNSEKIIQSLSEAVSQAYEGMSFTEIDGFKKINKLPDLSPDYYYSFLKILQPFSADFYLIIDKQILLDVLEATMPEDQTRNKEKIIFDILNEYINVIAGTLMMNLLPPDEEFKLGLPQCGKYSEKKSPFILHKNSIGVEFTIEFSKIYCLFTPTGSD